VEVVWREADRLWHVALRHTRAARLCDGAEQRLDPAVGVGRDGRLAGTDPDQLEEHLRVGADRPALRPLRGERTEGGGSTVLERREL